MDVKPGWQTTEFWITLLTNVVGLVHLFKPSVIIGESAIAQVAAIAVIIVTNAAYIFSRMHTKAVAANASTTNTVAK